MVDATQILTLADEVRVMCWAVGGFWVGKVLRDAGVDCFGDMTRGQLVDLRATMLAAAAGMIAPMASDPFYWSAEWRACRRTMLARHPDCAVPGCGEPAKHVDHRVSRRRGGAAFDPANLLCLCVPHHSEKTARADGGFGNPTGDASVPLAVRGCDTSGRPRDPAHPWNATRVPPVAA